MKKAEKFNGEWKVHTPNLLKEILNNNETSALKIPLNIFGKMLGELGEIASKINDPELNHIMCRLTIYAIADPELPDFDPKKLKQIKKKGGNWKYTQFHKFFDNLNGTKDIEIIGNIHENPELLK